MGLEWEVQVRFPSDTPVAGIELNPWVRVNYKGSYVSPPNYALQFAWFVLFILFFLVYAAFSVFFFLWLLEDFLNAVTTLFNQL